MSFPETDNGLDFDRNDILRVMNYYGLEDFPTTMLSDVVEGYTMRASDVIFKSSCEWANFNPHKAQTEMQAAADLAELIIFLKACEGSELVIKGKVTNPINEHRKGHELTAKISNKHFNELFAEFVDTYLKVYLTMYHGEEYDTDTMPYPIEDLLFFRCYYNTKGKMPRDSVRRGIRANWLLDFIKPYTADWKVRKRYCFVYDIMRIAGAFGVEIIHDEGFRGDVGREKALQVKNWLNAFKSKEV